MAALRDATHNMFGGSCDLATFTPPPLRKTARSKVFRQVSGMCGLACRHPDQPEGTGVCASCLSRSLSFSVFLSTGGKTSGNSGFLATGLAINSRVPGYVAA